MSERDSERDPAKPYCEGGSATCGVCVGSCGIEEYEDVTSEQERQCAATTWEGKRCRKRAIKDGFCDTHQPQRVLNRKRAHAG